jgi:hypothetical protein
MLVWNDRRQYPECMENSGRFECRSHDRQPQGWRLPPVHELASLLIPPWRNSPSYHRAIPLLPVLQAPVGHTGRQRRSSPSNAWGVNFGNGEVTDFGDVILNSNLHWCVRGGMNADEH